MAMFTLKDCAKFLQISTITIRRMITNKTFCKVKRIGGQIRVMDTDFLSWVENQNDNVTEYNETKNRRFLNQIDRLKNK